MRRSRAALASIALAVGALGGTVLATGTAAAGPSHAVRAAASPDRAGVHTERVCAVPRRGHAACNAVVRTTPAGRAMTAAARRNVTPSGYGPADLQSAYGLTSLTGSAGAGRTVAIVDAYDDPTAARDLATYRSTYGLPGAHFTKVSQTGSTTALPAVDSGWAQEISLDLDMVSAACPRCSILLVETRSSSFSDLAAGVRYARARAGVVAVSNSYGGTEASSETSLASSYAAARSGQWITASTGDSGYGAQSPAVFNTVVAVGGTSLTRSGSSWAESAWSGAGSGCSAYIRAAFNTAGPCGARRGEADVSAVADPATGVAVYDSTPNQGQSGWFVFGGTSASAPLVAAVHALHGSSSTTAAGLYSGASVWDITSGNNGSCSTRAVCHAGTGWDGPTGVGTPKGPSLAGF